MRTREDLKARLSMLLAGEQLAVGLGSIDRLDDAKIEEMHLQLDRAESLSELAQALVSEKKEEKP